MFQDVCYGRNGDSVERGDGRGSLGLRSGVGGGMVIQVVVDCLRIVVRLVMKRGMIVVF